jgi:transmembrane sensor
MTIRQTDAPSTASEWIAEAANHELNAAQRAALADWLRESPAHVREFLQMTLVQQDLGSHKISAEQIDSWVREAKTAAQQPTHISTAAERQGLGGAADGGRVRVALSLKSVWARCVIAACFAAALVTAGLVYQWQVGRYATAIGEQRIVTLTDGSVIEINTDSALQVRFSDTQRAIKLLKGEAFFRVAHDASRPFVVSAGDANVKAVGTQFNVRMGSTSTLVSVVEGTVEVRDVSVAEGSAANIAPQAPVRVSSGEAASIGIGHRGEGTHRVAKTTLASPQRAASWTLGRVEFEDTPLGDVLSEFQRYRDLAVMIDDDSVRQLKLTGSFDAHDPESALAYIATLPGIDVDRLDARTVRIHRHGQEVSPSSVK